MRRMNNIRAEIIRRDGRYFHAIAERILPIMRKQADEAGLGHVHLEINPKLIDEPETDMAYPHTATIDAYLGDKRIAGFGVTAVEWDIDMRGGHVWIYELREAAR